MEYVLPIIASLIIGMSKAGLKGVSIIAMTMMALAYGAKLSTGIVVPLLIFGDILAVSYYNRHARWIYLKKFLPVMMLGVIVATYVGKYMAEDVFQNFMALIILFSIIIMIIWEKQKASFTSDNFLFASSMGFTAGFTTMIGNLAGAFANIFFLAMRIPKNEFIATAAWLFFIINIFKLPFHIFSWKTISMDSLSINLYLVPVVLIGFALGLKIVSKFNETQFRYFILLMTALGALLMLIK